MFDNGIKLCTTDNPLTKAEAISSKDVRGGFKQRHMRRGKFLTLVSRPSNFSLVILVVKVMNKAIDVMNKAIDAINLPAILRSKSSAERIPVYFRNK